VNFSSGNGENYQVNPVGQAFVFFHVHWASRVKEIDTVTYRATMRKMIKSFKHRGLAELFEFGQSRRVREDLHARALRRLEALDQAESLTDLQVPGFNFHGLRGTPKRYSIHVNGPWSITFEWEEGDALRVDLEQYH
jgi:proteic killer suppression protein